MKVLLFITVLLSGLITGLFYAYSCSVNPGLKALQNSEYLKAMQSINRAILNPFFFVSFLGLLVMYPFTAYRLYTQPASTSFYLLIAAAIVYGIGVFGVTIFGNVPLNNQLDRFPVTSASPDDIERMRHLFEKPWNGFHLVRTIATIVSFGLTILSIMKQKI